MGGRKGYQRGAEDGQVLDAAHLRPSIHPTYARLLAAELKRRGFPDADIFEGTSLVWAQLLEEDRFLSFEQFRRLVLRAIELSGEGWVGLDVGRSTQISSHGPLGYAMVASPNVAQALDVVERYSSLRLQVARFSIERGGGRMQLQIADTVSWGNVSEYMACHIVAALCLLLETVSGMSLPDTRMTFSHPQPPWADEYRARLRGVNLDFGAPAIVIDMPESFGSTPCITADPASFRQAVRLCERAEEQFESQGEVAQRVLDRLLDHHGEYPSLDEMAKGLHMSSRTLIRKLKAQETSYQGLLDDVRQELALWYLQQTDVPVEVIAERLGYRDTSNFSRTCKRWFGLTPRSIRQG
jgi:AraC-like DNA-binding protein